MGKQIDQDLLQAIRKSDIRAVFRCLKQGANPNMCNPEGSPVIVIAASYGDSKSVYLLLKEGADPNAMTTNKLTALYIATARNYLEVVLTLLLFPETSIDIMCRTSDQVTALELAVRKGHTDIANILEQYSLPKMVVPTQSEVVSVLRHRVRISDAPVSERPIEKDPNIAERFQRIQF